MPNHWPHGITTHMVENEQHKTNSHFKEIKTDKQQVQVSEHARHTYQIKDKVVIYKVSENIPSIVCCIHSHCKG